MSKNNIRSFRYSDEVKDILENFEGNNMNEKFDNLIRYCFERIPFVEKRLADVENEIKERYQKLSSVRRQSREIDMLIGNLEEIKFRIEKAAECADIVAEKLM